LLCSAHETDEKVHMNSIFNTNLNFQTVRTEALLRALLPVFSLNNHLHNPLTLTKIRCTNRMVTDDITAYSTRK